MCTFMISDVFGPMTASKSDAWVRLVVPTSISLQPALAMISGIRNEPPISINSPRDTGTSLRRASADNTNKTAAALLLTTVAASAPVSSQISSSTWESRSPRRPLARSYSRLLGRQRRIAHCFGGNPSHWRAAKVGMNDRPGEIDNALHTGHCRRVQPGSDGLQNGGIVISAG